MASFDISVRKAIDQSIQKIISGYVIEFSTKLAESLNNEKKNLNTTESLIVLWNKTMNNKITQSPSSRQKKVIDPSIPQCIHVYGKGDKKDQKCSDKVSEKSISKSFCSRHYKQNESDKSTSKDVKDNSIGCCYIFTRGKNKDNECGGKISDKGKYCSKHCDQNSDTKVDSKNPKKKSTENEPIRAFRIKDGELKGFHAFERGGKKYVIDSETRIVKGCEEDGKLIDLDNDDIEMIRNTHPFKLDKKYEKMGISKEKTISNEEEENEDEENEE